MAPKIKTLTKTQRKKLELLGEVLSIEQIAQYFKMNKQTFYNIMEREPEVEEIYRAAKARAIFDVAGKLLTNAREGNMSAVTFYLKTQAGWRETEKIEHEINGKVELTIITGVPRAKDE